MLDASMRSTHGGLYDLSISLQHRTVFDCYPEELPNARESWRALVYQIRGRNVTTSHRFRSLERHVPCPVAYQIKYTWRIVRVTTF
jgi:hypothetical protein